MIIIKNYAQNFHLIFKKILIKNYPYILCQMNENIVIKSKKSSLESINGSSSLYYQVKKVENSSAGGGFRTHDLQIMSITLYVDWHSRPG